MTPQNARYPYGNEASGAEAPAKKPWASPKLHTFGDIHSLTQGGPPGTGDSGAGSMTQSPNFS